MNPTKNTNELESNTDENKPQNSIFKYVPKPLDVSQLQQTLEKMYEKRSTAFQNLLTKDSNVEIPTNDPIQSYEIRRQSSIHEIQSEIDAVEFEEMQRVVSYT